ncbi:hypothetical protein AC1031_020604 [Aphanomyces cochlioides]|nr:hypothetical protein AC1031_020604 [Aphanomyces cochlioides]
MVTRAEWTPQSQAFLVGLIREQIVRGKTSDTGLKKEAWKAIVDAFNSEFNVKYTRDQLQSQRSKMQSDFNMVQTLLNLSGFGWNEHMKTVIADPATWDDYIDKHPAAKKFRNKPFELYSELHEIFSGVLATGEFASIGEVNDPIAGEVSIATPHDDNYVDNSRLNYHSEASDLSQDPRQSERGDPSVGRLSSIRKSLKRNRQSYENPKASIATAVEALVATQNKGTLLMQAIEIFNSSLAPQYTSGQRLHFCTTLGNTPTLAEIYVASDPEVRELIVKQAMDPRQ